MAGTASVSTLTQVSRAEESYVKDSQDGQTRHRDMVVFSQGSKGANEGFENIFHVQVNQRYPHIL